MENSKQIVGLVSEGLSPSLIAKQCNLGVGLVIQEILKAVDAGQLLRSQVQSTLNADWLKAVGLFAQHRRKFPPVVIQEMVKLSEPDCGLDVEEIAFYMSYASKEFRAGETYELLSEIERTLHEQIRMILVEEIVIEEEEYETKEILWRRKAKETAWWRKGVPEKVRVDCARAREQDTQLVPEHPYSYTTLINLKEIICNKAKGKGWHLFKDRLPKSVAAHKDDFEENLDRLNGIRNRVMHPVRGAPPSEEDLKFVRRMQETLHLSKWRKRGGKTPL
jgi:hypothetical protein